MIAYIYYVYAILLLVGGLVGFIRRKSVASLGGSAVAAILVAVASIRLHDHLRSALGIGIFVALVIGVFFAGRYQASKKPMPAIPIIVISALVLILSVLRLAGVHF
jgi:uncharacterized membrane protein (UPF0136 family)